jgi:hypothetical protein
MTATIDIPATEAAGGGRQFVTFQVRDELFGLPLADVREIIRMPELVEPAQPGGHCQLARDSAADNKPSPGVRHRGRAA